MWNERPQTERAESDRTLLEKIVARQISDLLGHYGSLTTIQVDNGSCASADQSKEYLVVDLDPICLEDDGELIIGHCPATAEGYCTDKGAYSVEKLDYEGIPVVSLLVWDERISIKGPRVLENGKSAPSFPLLHELHDSLIIAEGVIAQIDTPNPLTIGPSDYPQPVMEPDFEAIIATINDQ